MIMLESKDQHQAVSSGVVDLSRDDPAWIADTWVDRFVLLSKVPFVLAIIQALVGLTLNWFCYLLFINIFSLPIPDSTLLNALFFNGSLSFNTLLLIALIAGVAVSVLHSMNGSVCYLLGEFIAMRVRLVLFKSFATASTGSYKKKSTSDLMMGVTGTADAFRNYYCNFHSTRVFNSFRLLFTIITIFLCSWQVGLFMLVVLVASYIGVPINLLFINKQMDRFDKAAYPWFRKVLDLCGGYELVFLHNTAAEEVAVLEKTSSQLVRQVLPISGYLFIRRCITVGVMMITLPILLLFQHLDLFGANVSVLFICLRLIDDMHNAWDRIDACLDPYSKYKQALQDVNSLIEEPFDIGIKLPSVKAVALDQDVAPLENSGDAIDGILMKDVRLGYETISGAPPRVVLSVDLHIPHGVIGLVGESGSGKSTFLKSLYGALKPLEGRVLCDGIDIYRNQTFWLDRISVIPQDSYLFNRSIRDNISYGLKRTVSHEEIEEAAKAAAAHDFIMNLPEQYDTLVESGGSNLSGGQRQRIHFARGVLRKAEYVFMDEPTSALDHRIQESLIASLKEMLSRNIIKSFVVSTHRMELLELCDMVFLTDQNTVKLSNDYSRAK